MNPFNKHAAVRIALASILLACVSAPMAWIIATEKAEEGIVALAMEESNRFLRHVDAIDLSRPEAAERARNAADMIVGGVFDIAEIYDRSGNKLAEAMTSQGEGVEPQLPKHGQPSYREASYESLELADGRWGLRVFVPLRGRDSGEAWPASGFFEGVRIVPDWQKRQIRASAFSSALLACLAALLCGATIYPIVVHLSTENDRKAREVLDSHISMMEALGRAIAKRDSDTGAHNYRVAWIACRIGEEIGLAGSRMQALIAGSFLHDVGKIGIPDAILLKPGRLDDAEMAIMRTHVALGEQIVTGMGWLDGAQEVVAAHHEKWDGTGYPRGLWQEQIPLAARIFAVADVFDALSSRRPYKSPQPFEEVMETLKRSAATHFDPDVIEVFVAIADEVHTRLLDCTESSARQLLERRIRKHFER